MIRRVVFVLTALALVAASLVSSQAPVQAQTDRAWLAIGDSYASGEGIPGTNTDPVLGGFGRYWRDCRRADGLSGDARAWSLYAYDQLAADAGFSSFTLTACTGAVSSELGAQISEAGARRGGRLRWDLITVSIGGNDVRFSEIIKGCLDLNSLWGAFDLTPGCDVTERELRSRVDLLRESLVRDDGTGTYDMLAEHVENGGDVIVVGYPHLIEEVDRWNWWDRPTCAGLHEWDVPMLRSATGYLNEQIGQAVLAADAKYAPLGISFHFLDISQDPYEYSDKPGHRHGLCTQDPWLNGVTMGITSGDWWELDRSFHPHQKGHDNTGRVLTTYIRDNVRFEDVPPGFGPSPFGTPAEAAIGFMEVALAGGDISNLVSLWQHDHLGNLHFQPDNAAYSELEQLARSYEEGRVLAHGPSREPSYEDDFGPGCSLEGDAALLCIIHYRTTADPGPLLTFEVWVESDPAGGFRVVSVDLATVSQYEIFYFQSPSGNIACELGDGQARCDLRQNNWTIAPQDAVDGEYCEYLDWGDSVYIEVTGAAHLLCHGDTTFGADDTFTLDYGQSVADGPIWCGSTEAGMWCGSTASGRSFRVARNSYELR